MASAHPYVLITNDGLGPGEAVQAMALFMDAERFDGFGRLGELLKESEAAWFVFVKQVQAPVTTYKEDIGRLMETDKSYFLSEGDEVSLIRRADIQITDVDVRFAVSERRVLFSATPNPVDHVALADPKTPAEYLETLRLYAKGYPHMCDKSIPYQALRRVADEKLAKQRAYNLCFAGAPTPVSYPHARVTTWGSTAKDFMNATGKAMFFEHMVVVCEPGQADAPVPFERFNAVHAHYPVVRVGPYLSVQAFWFHYAIISLLHACRGTKLPTPEEVTGEVLRMARERIVSSYGVEGVKAAEEARPSMDEMKRMLDAAMSVKDFKRALELTNRMIETNTDVRKIPELYTKKIGLHFMIGSDDKEIEKELAVIVCGTTDEELLNMLMMLVASHRNDAIKEALYAKVIKNSITSQFTKMSMKALAGALQNPKTKESTLDACLDVIEILRTNENMPARLSQDLMKRVFLIANSGGFTEIHKRLAGMMGAEDGMDVARALASPNCIPEYVYHVTTRLDPYGQDRDTLMEGRRRIGENIDQLLQHYRQTYTLDTVWRSLPVHNFYLSYQGVPSRDLFVRKSQLVRKLCPELNVDVSVPREPTDHSPVRVLFHANFLNRRHSVYKDRHQVIRHMSEDPRFEVFFSTFENPNDEVKTTFGRAKHIKLDYDLPKAKDAIAKLRLDAMVFCEIGMCPLSYYLAHMRFAPVQFNTWGHSDTSGISTIDYFVSSELYELPYEEAQTHYSEKLILQQGMCTAYVNPMARYDLKTFRKKLSYGFTSEVKVIFCAQSMFKINPEFDDMLVRILHANPNAVLMMSDGGNKEAVLKRFDGKGVTARIHLSGMLAHQAYMNMMAISDIVLDPYPFGGCNSSLEAFSLGKPVVTRPSQMINGRFTAGFYQRMRLDHCIAHSADAYVDIANRLLQDDTFYQRATKDLQDRAAILYDDAQTIQEWKDMILDKVL